jgi:PD-(D/E)XK endonuclease
MKKRKMSKIKDKKVRGEWAEMKFMTCAAERGLCVSKPWGDSNSYDFVVGRPGHFVAVQVKCTVFSSKNGAGYICSVCSSHKQYRRGAFDFLAAYLVCEDVWYIIPEKATRGKWAISLRTQCVESRHEKYLEAWDLLRQSEFNGDIQACAEEFTTPSDGHDQNESDAACQLGALVEFTHYVEPHIVFSGS